MWNLEESLGSLRTNKSRLYRYRKNKPQRIWHHLGAVTETGGVLLADEIKINAEIQLVKQVVKEAVEEEELVVLIFIKSRKLSCAKYFFA